MKSVKGLMLAGLLLPGVCLADAGNFNFVQLSYQSGEQSGFDVDGWAASGSFEITDRFFIAGGFNTVELDDDVPGLRLDGETQQIGVGYIFGENETGTFYGTASYVRVDVKSRVFGTRFTDDGDGYSVGLGVRMNIGPQAELFAAVNHLELDGGESNTVPTAGLVYKFTERFAGVVDYSAKSGDDMLGLGFRFYF